MINPHELYDKALEAGEDWADKEHAAGLLEDAMDTIKGVIAADLKAKGESISLIANLIKKDSRWIESAKAFREARKEAMKAKIKYDQVNRYQDNIRTKESTERALGR